MDLGPCPRCARPISQHASFCVHCRAPLLPAIGSDLPTDQNGWAALLEKLATKFTSALSKVKGRWPSSRLCLLSLLAIMFLQTVDEVFSAGQPRFKYLGDAMLAYGFMMGPALLAFLLIMFRRPIGLYGALPVFLSWCLLVAGWVGLNGPPNLMPSALRLLTVLVSGCGAIAAYMEAAGGKLWARILGFVLFVALEVGQLVLLVGTG